MSTVQEIETAVQKLKPQEIHEVADWLQELREELWDKQIDADAKAGRLDKLMEEAKQDYLAGRCKPLNEILNKSCFSSRT
jgi:predicted HAD superfamily phosphohydrolase YqeG